MCKCDRRLGHTMQHRTRNDQNVNKLHVPGLSKVGGRGESYGNIELGLLHLIVIYSMYCIMFVEWSVIYVAGTR